MRPEAAPHLRVIQGGRETGRKRGQRRSGLAVAMMLSVVLGPLEVLAALLIF